MVWYNFSNRSTRVRFETGNQVSSGQRFCCATNTIVPLPEQHPVLTGLISEGALLGGEVSVDGKGRILRLWRRATQTNATKTQPGSF
jgi:hypothetical protein